jgi:hypothetical protein
MTTSTYNNLLTQATKLDTPIGLESTAQFIFGGQSYVGRPSVQGITLQVIFIRLLTFQDFLMLYHNEEKSRRENISAVHMHLITLICVLVIRCNVTDCYSILLFWFNPLI